MTITDIITLALSIFLIFRGASRGFLASLLGPIALILATVVSYIFYQCTQNLLISLCIGLAGPFILTWVLRAFLHSVSVMSNSVGKYSPLSRVAGALVTWIWGMAMLIITILLLAMVPPVNKQLDFLYKDVHLSKLYHAIKPLDSAAIDQSSDTENEAASLAEDQRIQDIVKDPTVVDAINRKDYSALISNPKFAALVQDPVMMKKMLRIYRQMMKEQMSSQTAN